MYLFLTQRDREIIPKRDNTPTNSAGRKDKKL